MLARTAATFLLIPLLGGCASLFQRPIDLTNTAPQFAVLCDGQQTMTLLGNKRVLREQALIYPAADLKSMQIELTGQFHLRPLCGSNATCEIKTSDNTVRIVIRPLPNSGMEPGSSELFQFDQKTGTLIYGSGGMDGSSSFKGKCKVTHRTSEAT
jgi:hypothetical protein